ncbi:CopG family transcriptional regulator [Alicycliphilus denitrificans]|uniref:ribbon-helix-helix domain-containing protein n=1 Tax=Alicycliphilus denitrificans TaxID=179636 RepID=UPI00384FC893
MRTTVDLDMDALLASKELARAEGVSLGKVISRLVRQALTGSAAAVAADSAPYAASATGFVPFAPRGVVVSNELIDKLRDGEGV